MSSEGCSFFALCAFFLSIVLLGCDAPSAPAVHGGTDAPVLDPDTGPPPAFELNTYEIAIHALGTATLPGATMGSTQDTLAASIEAMSIASATLSGES